MTISELHINVDIETLSLSSEAVVLSVGWAVFETQADRANESGVLNLRINEQLKTRDVSESTLVDFWMKQSQKARELAFLALPRISVPEFIQQFQDRIQWHNIQGVWCKGLHFDLPILHSLYRQYNAIIPWHYRTPRDMRTLTWLAGMNSADHVKPVIAHSAEHDAIAQAETVQIALKKLCTTDEMADAMFGKLK